MQGRARPLGVSGGGSKESDGAKLQFCVCAPPLASPPPSSLLADSFSSSTSCPVSYFLASRSLLHDIRLFLLCPLFLSTPYPLPRIHTLLSTPSSHFPPSSSDHSPPLAALFTYPRFVACL